MARLFEPQFGNWGRHTTHIAGVHMVNQRAHGRAGYRHPVVSQGVTVEYLAAFKRSHE
jgi:hypothetical protein